MTDRRTTRRESAVCPLDVLDANGRPVGCMADLSTGGMRLSRIADPDDCLLTRLSIEIPRWVGIERTLELPGRFVWFRETARGLEAGFAFEKLPARKEEALELLIEKLAEMWAECGLPSTASTSF